MPTDIDGSKRAGASWTKGLVGSGSAAACRTGSAPPGERTFRPLTGGGASGAIESVVTEERGNRVFWSNSSHGAPQGASRGLWACGIGLVDARRARAPRRRERRVIDGIVKSLLYILGRLGFGNVRGKTGCSWSRIKMRN